MATGRASDGSENPNLCKHRACDTVIGTESADLPLRPAVSKPHEEAGGDDRNRPSSQSEEKLLPGRRRSEMHRCEVFNLLHSSAFLFNSDALFCRDLQKSE